VSFHAEGSEHRLIPEPRLEGGISGVRGMPEVWQSQLDQIRADLQSPERKAA
jgi:hypothetical protein